jgi:hypothetical protein
VYLSHPELAHSAENTLCEGTFALSERRDRGHCHHLASEMTPGIGNETVKITYNIVWSTFDVTSKLPYIERVALRGDDTRPGEVGPDDLVKAISSTTLTPSGSPNVAVPRTHTKTLVL